MSFVGNLYAYNDIVIRRIQLYRSIRRIKYSKESFVIMFHDVNFENKNCDNYGINITDFKKCIEALKKLGYEFVSMKELKSIRKNENGYCVITFDDGFCSTYRLMKEFMIKNTIPFQVFITSDWIDKEGYITTAEIKEMAEESLCFIGSHSKSHPMFRYLSAEEEDNEYETSKRVISNLIKTDLTDFAFPYGSNTACSYKNIVNAYSIGFTNVYLTIPNTLRKCNYGKGIPRINGVEVAKYI